MPTPRRVLVIGGTGFMGRHVTAALRAHGHEVTVLARHERAVPAGVPLLLGDRSDAASLSAALEGRGFDLTVDFAAFDRPDIERLFLLPHARLGLYVLISSGQTYLVTRGTEPPFREEDADGPLIPEPAADSPDHGDWEYGVGKRRAEAALFALRATHGVRGVALRLPIVQGAGDSSRRLWAWIERMRDGGPILVPDGGTRPVRHVWAGDVARAIAWLASHEDPPRAVYNLAQPDSLPFHEWIRRLATLLGASPTYLDVPWDTMYAAGLDRWCAPYAGRWASAPDPARIQEEWGFRTTPSEEYLPGVVRAHLDDPPAESHFGYAQRPLERALAERLRAGR